MSASLVIKDASTGNEATVTEFGQLVVAPVDYSEPVAQVLSSAGTTYNFIEPVADKSIVITDIILTANKGVGVNDATVSIYETGSIDSLISAKDILNLEMIKQSNLVLTGLNMIVPPGLFVNALTDDASIFVTIMFYRVPI